MLTEGEPSDPAKDGLGRRGGERPREPCEGAELGSTQESNSYRAAGAD